MKFATMDWVVWAVLLILQNMAHTVTQRAKNQDKLVYTTVASVFSNGIWILSNVMMVGQIVDFTGSSNWKKGMFVVGFYVLFTTIGTVVGQIAAMCWFEKWVGKR